MKNNLINLNNTYVLLFPTSMALFSILDFLNTEEFLKMSR